jgi:hypothetical protein
MNRLKQLFDRKKKVRNDAEKLEVRSHIEKRAWKKSTRFPMYLNIILKFLISSFIRTLFPVLTLQLLFNFFRPFFDLIFDLFYRPFFDDLSQQMLKRSFRAFFCLNLIKKIFLQVFGVECWNETEAFLQSVRKQFAILFSRNFKNENVAKKS